MSNENVLLAMLKEYRDMKEDSEILGNKIKAQRLAILKMFNDIGILKAWDSEIEAKVSYPKSFDKGLCKMDNHELLEQYHNKVITERTVFDVKTFKKEQLKIYNKYLVSGSPRLTVK